MNKVKDFKHGLRQLLPMYKRMLLCVTSATPKEVVETAERLCYKGTEVRVLNVVHLLNDFVRKEVSKEFAWILDLFKKSGIKCNLDIVESTDVKTAIISYAKKNYSDVIVTGVIPRKGLLGYFSESISDYVVKNAHCTVILVRKAGQLA
jgi:nucleotide-binding universal stress UspA family protein